MKLEKIISLANKSTELRFLAMVRSLRSTGCDLPVWVIPFNDDKFDLPENCIWWEMDKVSRWLDEQKAHRTKRKYQCLLTDNYQFVDADIVFLKNPETELQKFSGFITSCGHWNNTGHTFSEVSLKYYKNKSTTWQKSVFNSGQFACDRALYDFDTLKEIIENPLYEDCFIDFNYHEQLALNFLAFLSGVIVSNMTLPPYNVESTWAGDYTDENYRHYWKDPEKMPYLIHWAGCKMDIGRPIDQLFLSYLSDIEKQHWHENLQQRKAGERPSVVRKIFSGVKRFIKS